MRSLALATIFLIGGFLFYGMLDFPEWGDPSSPASTHVSPYYIEHSIEDTAVPNIVTAVLADYRGYDTMFETTVIFAAGLACMLLLRTYRREAPSTRLYRHMLTGITLRIEKGGKIPEKSAEFERIDSQWVPHDLIVNVCCRLIVPFLQLYALYVIAHGHHSPGGGFQGGVVLGAALILYALVYDLRSVFKRLSERTAIFLSVIGVLLYVGTGLLCMLLGGNFLDYSRLAVFLGGDPVMARSHGILIVEVGVGMAVMAVMVLLYYNLSSAGQHDEGL
ncbi:MAG: Na(+)/H(+) antiporter subunit B [Desulfobacterales bacterium]